MNTPQTKAPATAGTGGGRENEQLGGVLDIDSTIVREALLNRLCLDGGATAAFSLRCLHAESPRLAIPILEHFARQADEIDTLLLSLADTAAKEAS